MGSGDVNTATAADIISALYPKTIDEVDRLCAVVDPDEEPFRSKYAADALLGSLDARVVALLGDGADQDADRRDALEDVKGLIARRRGAIAVDTEDWARGEELLMDARARLSRPSASSASCRAALLDADNLLGVLWTNRSEPERALPFLLEARKIHDE